MRRTLYNAAKATQSIAPAAHIATATGTSVDLGEARTAEIIVNCGTVTDGTHTLSVQESDDNTTFTAVAAADLLGSLPALTTSNGDQVHEVGYIGHKRYLRAVATVSGATTGAVYGVAIQVGFADQPVAR